MKWLLSMSMNLWSAIGAAFILAAGPVAAQVPTDPVVPRPLPPLSITPPSIAVELPPSLALGRNLSGISNTCLPAAYWESRWTNLTDKSVTQTCIRGLQAMSQPPTAGPPARTVAPLPALIDPTVPPLLTPAEVIAVTVVESPVVSPIPDVPPRTAVVHADCKSCTSNLGGPAFDLMTGDSGECTPGRFGEDGEAYPSHAFGRFVYGVYNCLCQPDPCYEPKWTPLADAAFFTPTARPVSQTRFRTNLTRGLATPDRAEYFWAKGIGNTRGAQAPDGRRVDRVRDDALTMYTEAATGRVGVYTEMTYHRVRPDDRPGSSGFGDLVLGTKTLLLDCELLQIAFQMQTTIPTANTEKGLGAGHTTLEPSVILGLKLSRDSYFQAQIGEWIPLGGDPDYAGAALRYNWSYNHILCRPLKNCPVIGTVEFRGVTFQDGAYTEPATGISLGASGNSYLAIGPGLRAFICDRADFGGGVAYGLGSAVGPRQEYRFDLRVRY